MKNATKLSAALLLLCAGLPLALNAEEQFQIIHPKTHHAGRQTPASEKGQASFKSHNCQQCHSVESKGGCLAPPLDGIGAYRGKPYIIARITLGDKFLHKFERLHPQGELMPHPRLPLEDSEAIASYLLTLPSPKDGFKIYSHAASAANKERLTEGTTKTLPSDLKNIEEGRKLLSSSGCLACHSVASMGGHFAPALDGISKRRDRSYVERVISKAELMPINSEDTSEYSERGNIMPPAGLTKEQIQKVTDFVMTL